jgi:hypothetical protein
LTSGGNRSCWRCRAAIGQEGRAGDDGAPKPGDQRERVDDQARSPEKSIDSRHRGRGISIANGIGHTGGALAPYIVLPAAAVSFALAFAVMAAIALIAAVLVMFGRRMNGRSIA